jgi:hypothetical protein
MEITLHAGVCIFNTNTAREPVFQHQLNISTMVLPCCREQPNQGGGEGGQGKGRQVEGRQGKGGQVEGGDRTQ